MATGVLKRAWDRINDLWVEWRVTGGAAHVNLRDADGNEVTSFGGGITGLLRSRLIEVATNEAPSTGLAAGRGYCYFPLGSGVSAIEIRSARLQANLVAATAVPNLRVRWCIATSADEADLLLPAEASLVLDADADLGQTGMFDLSVQDAGSVSFNVRMEPEIIPLSAGERFIFFRHALGSDLELYVAGIQEV